MIEDQTAIKLLSRGSHKKVTRICDNCNRRDILPFRDILKQESRFLAQKSSIFQHLCKLCSLKLFPPAKGRLLSSEHKRKISDVAKKRLSIYENKKYLLDRHGDKNPHFKKGVRFNSSGYMVRRDLVTGRDIAIHREVYERYHEVKLKSDEYIHHIDGNPLNNEISNLIKCSATEHKMAHDSLQTCGWKLFKKNFIVFDILQKKYVLNQN